MTFKPAISAKDQQAQSLPTPPHDEYPGKELEAMLLASNYRRWIMDLFKPFVRGHILEVGAGAGAFSEMFLQMRPASLTVLEPSSNLYSILTGRFRALDPAGITKLQKSTLSEAFDGVSPPPRSDTAVYINVLEHIENDESELQKIYSLLSPGGRLLIFVPALRFLMSRLDREMGHFRRYTIGELRSKCVNAGFRIELARYFDPLGILPWWFRYRVLNSNKLEPAAVRFHDRYIVPISRALETIINPPLGKNIVL